MNHPIDITAVSFSYLGSSEPAGAKKLLLEQLSLTINSGQVTCLLGANGAGKTTLINLILGRLTPDQGTITVFDHPTGISAVKHWIGAMLQNSSAPENATVGELINLFASYYPNPLSTTALISQLDLTPLINQRFGKLSGGQQQLVLLALALCGDPDLLFLDEPSVGMDVATRRVLWQVIKQLKNRGKTIILTTHYLEEADALADRIVVLHQGTIVADGTPQQLKASFEHKIIKARSQLAISQLQALTSVSQVSNCGHYVEVVTSDASATLAQWLTTEPDLKDFTVSNCNLEQAFLDLTTETNTKTNTNSQAQQINNQEDAA